MMPGTFAADLVELSLTLARDLLYKYFGQLELLELRFAEVKVSFSW